VHPIVTNVHPWDPEAGEYDGLNQLSHYLRVISRISHCLHPLGDMVHSNQNELIVPEGWKRSFEVYALDIEYLKF